MGTSKSLACSAGGLRLDDLGYVGTDNSISFDSQFVHQPPDNFRKSLSLKLFGAPQVLRDGVALYGKASQKRRLALLALLASAPSRALSRDRLIGVLWPERDGAQARKLLSESLYVLRKEFGDELLDTTSGDVVALASAHVACDVWEFGEAIAAGDLERAASISDAPFLDGLFLDEAEDFERWLDLERSRIARDRQRALEQLAGLAEREGRWLDSAQSWLRLLHDEPLSSRAVLGAANALAAGGEGPAALQTLSAFEERLRRELEVAPEPEVLELMQRLRDARPAGPARPASARMRSPGTPMLVEHLALSGAATSGAEAGVAVTPLWRRSAWWFGALVLTLAVVAGAWWKSRAVPTPSAFDERRLAVLYFRDGSAEGDLTPVADLITEAVIEQLAGASAFEVIPVSGVRPFRDGAVGLDSIARQLRVGSIVDGTVHRSGERLVVRLRLIDSETDAVVYATSLERGANELFALEEDVARDLALGIRQRLGREVRLTQLQHASTNVRAWRLVARGNRERDDAVLLMEQRRSEADSAAALRGLRRADSLYAQAAIEDPDWARPGVERGWTALTAARFTEGPFRFRLLDSALEASNTIPLRSADSLSVLELRSALRWARMKSLPPPFDLSEISAIAADLERVVEQAPDRARAWVTLSNIHLMRGEVDRAANAGRRALEADAYIEDAPVIYRNLIAASVYRQQLDSASAWCTRGRREHPADWWFTECALTIMKYDLTGRPDAARAWALVSRLDSLDPPALAASAGHSYAPVYRRLVAAAVSARAGDSARAMSELARQRLAAAEDPELQLDMIPDEITLLLHAGKQQEALERLRWAIERRPLLGGLIAHDPILAPLAREVLPADGSKSPRSLPIPR